MQRTYGHLLHGHLVTQNDLIRHMVTRGEGRVSMGVSHAPISGGGEDPARHISWDSYTQRNQILRGDLTRCQENFYRVDHVPGSDQKFL